MKAVKYTLFCIAVILFVVATAGAGEDTTALNVTKYEQLFTSPALYVGEATLSNGDKIIVVTLRGREAERLIESAQANQFYSADKKLLIYLDPSIDL